MSRLRRAVRSGARAVRRFGGSIIRGLRRQIDVPEFLFLCGIAGIGAGLYGIDWRLAATVVGGLLVYVSLFHPRNRTE